MVVIGGGPGGLAAALFSARRGANVTLIERDENPAAGSVEDDFNRWPRPGVPQARQSHQFLGLAGVILTAEAPDVLDAMRTRGVLEVPAAFRGRGAVEDAPNLRARRLVYEAVLRRAVLDQPGVDVIAGDRVTQLVARSGMPPVVCGVRTEQGLEIAAPIVVDATGRRSPLAKWVDEHGVAELPTTTEPIGLQYYTRFYRLHDGSEFPPTPAPIVARLRYLNALAFPCDNRTFSLTLACFVDDPVRRALADRGAFERVLSSIPVTAPWVHAGAAISRVHAMARIENRWQRLVNTDGLPLVGGVALVGDSSMHTNPTFGRGVSLALAQAQRLAMTLPANGDTVAYTADFERWTAQEHRDWFNVQLAYDKNLVATFQAALRGDPEPEPNEANRFFRAMVAAADTDEVAALAMTCFVHLLRKPSEVFADEDLNRRVRAYMGTHDVAMFDNEGPTRAEFEDIVAAA